MPENVTTVLNLPEAGDISTSDLLYLIQGEGSDRDRKATLESVRDFLQSVFKGVTCTALTVKEGGTLALTVQDSQAGTVTLEVKPYLTLHDKTYRISLSGSLSAIRFAQKCLFEAGLEVAGDATVEGTLKAPILEGTTQGTTASYLLVNSAMTVNGDADLKSNVWLGGTTMKVSLDDQKIEMDADAEVTGTLSASEVRTAKISPASGATVQVAGVLDTAGLKGSLTTDSITPKTAGSPVALAGSLTVSGALSAQSVAAAKLACSKLSLKDDGMAYAPALPFYIDTSDVTDLSRLCAGAPAGGRVTVVNASGNGKTYTFTSPYGAGGGYFTLQNGGAVDLLVTDSVSSSQALVVPIGVSFSTGG